MPTATEFHQEKLDMLKKQQLIPQDATIEDYGFLFEFEGTDCLFWNQKNTGQVI